MKKAKKINKSKYICYKAGNEDDDIIKSYSHVSPGTVDYISPKTSFKSFHKCKKNFDKLNLLIKYLKKTDLWKPQYNKGGVFSQFLRNKFPSFLKEYNIGGRGTQNSSLTNGEMNAVLPDSIKVAGVAAIKASQSNNPDS